MSEKANGILKHHVLEEFLRVLRKSSLRNEKQEYLERTDIEILETNQADTGWDVFCIDYMIPDIIGYVIDNKTRLNLLRLSNYFWKVRRCYYKLNDIWLEQKNILQKLNKSLPYSNVWNKCNLIRHHLTLFFNNLISYFINEVIESEWTILQRKLREGNPTFDDLKKAVQVFIENLLNKTFVETKYANIFDKLQCIFNICERFVNSYRILCCAYNEYLYNLLNEGEEKRRAAGNLSPHKFFLPNFSQPFCPNKKKTV